MTTTAAAQEQGDEVTLFQAQDHIRACPSCRANSPCRWALDVLYGGGLVAVTDPGRFPTPAA